MEDGRLIATIKFAKITGAKVDQYDSRVFVLLVENKPPFPIATHTTQDAQEVSYLICKVTQASFKGFKYGMLCFHEGPLEKLTMPAVPLASSVEAPVINQTVAPPSPTKTFVKIYARLVKGILLCYENEISQYPISAIALQGIVVNPFPADEVSSSGVHRFDATAPANGPSKARTFSFQTQSESSYHAWLAALCEERIRIYSRAAMLCGERLDGDTQLQHPTVVEQSKDSAFDLQNRKAFL